MFKHIAHRGLVDKNKENSLEAINEGLNSKLFYGVEIDIRTSKDNIFVCAHDFLENNKIISKTNYSELKKHKIARLTKILNQKPKKLLLIEIKEPNIDYHKLTNLLNKYNKLNIYVCSFYNKVIKNISELSHNFKLGVLNYVLNSEDNYIHYDFICLLSFITTDSLLNYFQNNNIEIFIYGNSREQTYSNKYYYIVDYKNLKSTHK